MQSSSKSSDFTEKLLNFRNISPADNEIATLMDTTVCNEEPSDRYMDNKLGEAIHKAIQSHNVECREEAQAEKQEYIDLVDSSVRTIIRGEVKTQLLQILSKAVSDFATPVIERNITELLEVAILGWSASQPKSTYEAVASLSKYELTKMLLDKMEESKSHLRADYKRELYDALVKSYNNGKDLFKTYGEVFMLKRSRDEKDKDQDPFTGSNRGTKRRKSNTEDESQKDPRSKEEKSSSSSKDTSRSYHKSSGKSVHVEEPSHTVDDSREQKNQEFDMGNNDEQPTDEAAPKNDYNKDGIPAKEEIEWTRQAKGSCYVYNIDKLLFERRLMRNLEKFVGGREYRNDLRLLERTI
nr:hypothetical protein [Tanacetum cinerariifolium]